MRRRAWSRSADPRPAAGAVDRQPACADGPQAGLCRPLPGWLSRASARPTVAVVSWCSETLALLESDNVTDPAALERWLPTGRRARTAAGHAAPRLNGNRRMALSAVNTVPCGQRLMHASLVVVWLGTALVSALEHKGLSARLLADAGILDTHWQALLVWSGLLADLAVGLALWLARPLQLSGRAGADAGDDRDGQRPAARAVAASARRCSRTCRSRPCCCT